MFCRNLLKPGLHSRKIKTYFEQMQTLDSREFIDQGVVEGGIFQFLKKLFIPTHDDDDDDVNVDLCWSLHLGKWGRVLSLLR